MINFRFILKLYGKLLYIEFAFIAICALIALIYGENDLYSFIWSGLIVLAAAIIFSHILPAKDNTITRKDGYFIVSSIWVLFSLFGSLPYIISGCIPNFVDAFFETMSGFTTTGSTILTDIESLPHATLFWRSLTQWLGGMGIITLFIALLPSLGIEGRDLYIAEDTSPVHSKTGATFAFTTRSLWGIYIFLTALCLILFWVGGMNWFEAVNHSFTTLSSGGFSTSSESMAHFGKFIQYTAIIFMFVTGINYTLTFSLLNRHRKQFFRDTELIFYSCIVIVSAILISVALYLQSDAGRGVEESIRESLFTVVSIITTTGYVTGDYTMWPHVLLPILMFIMFVGACSGSTSGGLKSIRGVLVFKNIIAEMKRIIHPNAIILIKYNKKGVQPTVTTAVMNFFVVYMVIIIISSVVIYLLLGNHDWVTSIGAALTSISNVGPGFGDVGPVSNFAWMPSTAKLFCAILMLIGRLEIFTVLVLFTREFWRR